jgi:hypothetical protein
MSPGGLLSVTAGDGAAGDDDVLPDEVEEELVMELDGVLVVGPGAGAVDPQAASVTANTPNAIVVPTRDRIIESSGVVTVCVCHAREVLANARIAQGKRTANAAPPLEEPA